MLGRGHRHDSASRRERSRALAEPARGGSAARGPARRLFLLDGPSLVYRAFFALPESIATSTGVPTNAIFGFASMLVKIVTDYGVRPTIVAWDAGTSGRTELFAEYKAQRRSRPDLLKQQWPAMEPLVEAFGYRNVTVEGYEADDVIASLAERALQADPPVPVMIVTGDRDVFQLIDDEGLVKVMATSRGITETKIYDRQAVIDRYGIPPELIPDFYGLKGDTSDNIPGIPGIGDKTASELIQRFGSLEDVLAHVEEVNGAKRKQNLLEHAEDARVSKRLATVQRDLAVDFDIAAEAAREPDRSRLREVFREYELRDPLRRLEEALGDAELAAPAPTAEVRLTARVRAGAPREIARLGAEDSELCVAVRAARAARGGAVRGGRALALRRGRRRPGARRASAPGPRRSWRRAARGRWWPTTPRRSGWSRRTSSTTRCSAPTCSSPPAAATRLRSCARSAAWPATSRTRSPPRPCCIGALADWQREQIAERGLGGA